MDAMEKPLERPIIISEVVLQENKNLELVTAALERTLRKVFGEGQNAERFIDVTRIPLICQNINAMHDNIKEIKDTLKETATDHEKRLRNSEDNMLEFKNALEKTYGFMTEQKKEKEYLESFWGSVKLNWLNYVIVALTMALVGSFAPLIFNYIRQLFT